MSSLCQTQIDRPPTRTGRPNASVVFGYRGTAVCRSRLRRHDDDRRSRTRGDFHRSLIPLVPRQNGNGCGVASPGTTVEIEQYWAPLIAAAHTLTTAKFAESLIDRTREFSQQRPAYFILRDAQIKVSRGSAARKHLREAFVQAFQAKKPTLSHEEALLIADLVVETVKGFLSVIAAAPPNRRVPVTAEFTKMLSLYLEAKFR